MKRWASELKVSVWLFRTDEHIIEEEESSRMREDLLLEQWWSCRVVPGDTDDHSYCHWRKISCSIDTQDPSLGYRDCFAIAEPDYSNRQGTTSAFDRPLEHHIHRWTRFDCINWSPLNSWSPCDGPMSNRYFLRSHHRWDRHDSQGSRTNWWWAKVPCKPNTPERASRNAWEKKRGNRPPMWDVDGRLRRRTWAIHRSVCDRRTDQQSCFRIWREKKHWKLMAPLVLDLKPIDNPVEVPTKRGHTRTWRMMSDDVHFLVMILGVLQPSDHLKVSLISQSCLTERHWPIGVVQQDPWRWPITKSSLWNNSSYSVKSLEGQDGSPLCRKHPSRCYRVYLLAAPVWSNYRPVSRTTTWYCLFECSGLDTDWPELCKGIDQLFSAGKREADLIHDCPRRSRRSCWERDWQACYWVCWLSRADRIATDSRHCAQEGHQYSKWNRPAVKKWM